MSLPAISAFRVFLFGRRCNGCTAEGLVSAAAHRQVVVPTLTAERIAEIFEVRALLEGHMLGLGAKRLSKEDLGRLEDLADSMDRIKSRDAWLEEPPVPPGVADTG